jgi:hypothetical protein
MRFLVFIVLFKFVYSLSCRDEDGHEVDWFIVYKIPTLQKDPSKLLNTGYSYAFMTGDPLSTSLPVHDHASNSVLDSWKLSDKLITDDKSIFGQTIGPLYDNKEKISHVMYNDQPPNSVGESVSTPGYIKYDPLPSEPVFEPDHSVNERQTAKLIITRKKPSAQGNPVPVLWLMQKEF